MQDTKTLNSSKLPKKNNHIYTYVVESATL